MPAPDSSPSLGSPSLQLPGQSNSSSYRPLRNSGPTLPEAKRDGVSPDMASSSKQPAVDPQACTFGRFRTEPAASSVSASATPSIFDEPSWSRYYRSTDNRPIETLIVGSGPTRIAILASMHGDETQSVSLVEKLANALQAQPESLRNSTSVLFVKTPNPDGFFGRSPYNVNGVDLNRNFPSANWKDLKHTRAGRRAASEAETRVIMRVLSDFHPGLIVHLKDSRSSGIVNFEGDSQSRAEQIAGLISCKVVQGLGEKTSGSLESYALSKLACPSLTLLLACEASHEAAWVKNRDALFSLVAPLQSSPSAGQRSNTLDAQPDPFEEPAIHKSSLRRQRSNEAANVRNATPAKSKYREPLPDFPAPVPDQGYYELPAP